MSFLTILALIPLAFLLWWFGFKATERLRIEKNAERADKAKKLGIDLPANTETDQKTNNHP